MKPRSDQTRPSTSVRLSFAPVVPDGKLTTVVKNGCIRRAGGLIFCSGDWLSLADSAIPQLVPQNTEHQARHAPHYVRRFRPGTRGAAGQ